MSTMVKEARYILTSLENNNNKFWNIRLFDDQTCETQWGRVGENGQSKSFAGASETFFNSKCREKEGKGYKPQKTLGNGASSKTMENDKLADVAKSQIVTNSPETLALVTYLAKANIHSILQATTMQYDTSRGTFSTPLGIVTADAIEEARGLLTDISAYVHAQDYGNTCFLHKLNDYLMLVPQNIGRGRPDPKVLYPDLEAVQAQNNILDGLEASLQTVLSAPKTKRKRPCPKLFEAKLNLVDEAAQIARIRAKYHATLQADACLRPSGREARVFRGNRSHAARVCGRLQSGQRTGVMARHKSLQPAVHPENRLLYSAHQRAVRHRAECSAMGLISATSPPSRSTMRMAIGTASVRTTAICSCAMWQWAFPTRRPAPRKPCPNPARTAPLPSAANPASPTTR